MRGTTVITGASAGIGAALALRLAHPQARLALSARRVDALADVARACAEKGAEVEVAALDVTDSDALSAWLHAVDRDGPVDRIVANAGVALDESDVGRKPATTRRVLDVNLTGALNTVLPLLPAMRERRRGQIVLMSSLAAFAPLADTPAYSASKAALLAFGTALRDELRPCGIGVSVVCPGFVRTGMADRYRGWRPFEISAASAAERIVRGLERDQGVIAFPTLLAFASRLQSLLPEPVRRASGRTLRFRIEGGT